LNSDSLWEILEEKEEGKEETFEIEISAVDQGLLIILEGATENLTEDLLRCTQ
jgi:hypothetical protein